MEDLTEQERVMLAQALKGLAVTFPPEWAVTLGYAWVNLARKLGVWEMIQAENSGNGRVAK